VRFKQKKVGTLTSTRRRVEDKEDWNNSAISPSEIPPPKLSRPLPKNGKFVMEPECAVRSDA